MSQASLEKRLAVGGYIAGGAAIAAGVALLYLNRPYLVEREDTTADGTGVSMVPVVSADMFGMLVTLIR